MITQPPAQMTPREAIELEAAERNFDKQTAYNLEIAKLNLETAKLEVKWKALLSVPITIVKLPVLCLFGIAYIVAVARGVEPSESFWKLINK